MPFRKITLSFPVELNAILHHEIRRGEISRYVAEAVRKSLEEDRKLKKQSLEAAYLEANQDPEREQTAKEWDVLDTDQDWTTMHKIHTTAASSSLLSGQMKKAYLPY